MSFEIAEYSDQTKANFIDSVSVSWLSELVNSSTLSNFCSKHHLPDRGRLLFEEVDYENLSGVSNPNLTTAADAYHFVNSIAELYKSPRFDYKRVYVKQTDEPLVDSRVFIHGQFVHLETRFYP